MIEKRLLDWFIELLKHDATTGCEFSTLRYLEDSSALWFLDNQTSSGWQRQMVAKERFNLYGCYGVPRLVFCTHVDTVAPYIPPSGRGDRIYGRGSCDAKGQIFTLLLTVRRLIELGFSDFATLLVVGEEQDSCGAKLANQLISGTEHVLVLEPTCNKLISAAKGSLRVQVEISGKSAHSGYPVFGRDAIQSWASLNQRLLQHVWPDDPELGATTFNWGKLCSHNADNVIADAVSAQLHWRTTFISGGGIAAWLKKGLPDNIRLSFAKERLPFRFKVLPGFDTDTVSYGCDAPYLSNLGAAMMYGPGDIMAAHGMDEFISLQEVEKAVVDLVDIGCYLLG